MPGQDGGLASGGSGDGGGVGVGLEGSGVFEVCVVVAEFGQDAGAGEGAETGEAGDDLGVFVAVEGGGDRGFQLVGAGAGCVELPLQGEGLGAHGLLDEGLLAHLGLPQQGVQAFDFGRDLSLPACFLEDGTELGPGELGCLGGCGGCCEQGSGDGRGEAFAEVLEDGAEAGEVLAKVGAQAVAGLGAVPDGVLLGAGQSCDGLGQLAVCGEWRVLGAVGAQDVGQDFGVEMV